MQSGDIIELDVEGRRLHLAVAEAELARRRAGWKAPAPGAVGGYQRLYIDHVLQAHRGADFDFLVGCRGADIPKESH